MHVGPTPPAAPLAPDAMERLDAAWRRIVADVGLRFDLAEARDLLAAHGQATSDDGITRLDPEWVLAQVAHAPGSFRVHGRGERAIPCGEGATSFVAAYGAPFIREGAARRDATAADFDELVRLCHAAHEIDSPGGVPCEPADLPVDSRHLEMALMLHARTDKPVFAAVISGDACRDTIAMAAIVHGGPDALAARPALMGILNVNSPLVWDGRMLESLLALARAGQASIVTPAVMLGAMAPVTIAGGLAQWLAEGLAGVALAQAARPGAPCLLGAGLPTMDMRSGAPSFGSPETALSLLASAQLARRHGIPVRAIGGGLTASPLADAQAAYEAGMLHAAALAARADVVVHAFGWLENGLSVSREKVAIDLEIVRTLCAADAAIVVDDGTLALDAQHEVGPGGHFLDAAHTLARYRDAFYAPLVSTVESHERFSRRGSPDATARAAGVAAALLERYEEPPLDDAVREELDAFVARRRAELGD